MVVKNRNRMEILYEIVSAAKMSARKTHLVYKSNVSFKQLDVYLNSLMKAGLIKETNEEGIGRVYNITSRGVNFLDVYDSMTSVFNEPKKQHKMDLMQTLGSSQVEQRRSPLIEKAAFA